MSKKRKVIIATPIVLAALIFAILLIGAFWWNSNSKAVSSKEDLTSFVVPKGKSATEIGNLLYSKGYIKSPLAFKFYVQLTGKANNIQAGEYSLSPSFDVSEVVVVLTSQPVQIWVTIPEGLRREEIVEIFIEELGLSGENAVDFREEFLVASQGKEGYLFPDTYLLPKTSSATKAVSIMENTFDIKVDEEIRVAIAKTPYSLDQTVIMASLLERETITDAERPVVAGILYKRLEADWPLQVDASVQYAIANSKKSSQLDDWWPILSRANLDINSPYNLYRFTGLPPSPISNPGLSSIKAAAMPEESEYWFYIHDLEGNIHYAKTTEEHSANVAKYLGK